MNITRFSIRRPVGITMIVMLFVVLGLYSFHRIGVELLPAVNTPIVTVQVRYPGAGTEQVEQDVIRPLENSLSSLSDLKQMTAMAFPERAIIILEFQFWANSDTASIDATKYVNSARSQLPDTVNEPVVIKRDVNASPVMEISVLADKPLDELYSLADNVFVERLQRASGVSDVELDGGRDKEVAVEVDKDKLTYYNISLNQIISRIKEENVLLPAGSVFTNSQEINVRLLAQYKDPSELNKIYLKNAQGQSILLTDLATVRAQDKRVTRFARTNGQDVISLTVYKNSDANLVETAQSTKSQLAALQADYPDYEFKIITDESTYVQNSLSNTLTTLFEGLLTTSLILFLFLRGWRSSIAVLVAIPTSLIATFFVMYIAGFTFNMMTLMGMALCIGILVDDSIVVLENIHRHLHMGKPAAQAAEEGRSEIGMAAIAITLCDVVVFMPIAFMSGLTGQYFQQFGLTIVFATLFSLLISFTLTPMLASKLFADGFHEPKGKIWDFMNRTEAQATKKYEHILIWSLDNSKKVLSVALALFILAISLVPLGILGTEYMPKTDESAFRVNFEMPIGSTIDQTNAAVRQAEDYITTIPEVSHYLSSVGAPAGSNGRMSVQLVSRRDRSRSVWQITDQVRADLSKMLPQARIQVSETQSSIAGVSGGSSPGQGPSNTPIYIELRGNNMEELIRASYQVQDELKAIKGVKDIRSSHTEGMPEMRLIVDREKLRIHQTTIGQINNVFNAAISGEKAGVYANDPTNNGQDTDIYVRLRGSDGFKRSDILSIPVQTSNNTLVRLGDVATLKNDVGPVMLRRVDKQRSISVVANITDRPLGDVLDDVRGKLTPEVLGESVSYKLGGQASSMSETFGEMAQALALSLLLVYMLLAVLYESFSTPVIRMFSLPLGLIGSLFFLVFTFNTINLYSLIGILVMDGLVAKNGTLLLDYTLTLKERNYSPRDAIIEAGQVRLKPIFMTTLTMVVGMLPTALAMTAGSETRVSMAWVIIGGLLTSTVFTLIVTPIVFLYFETKPFSRAVQRVKESLRLGKKE